MAEPQAETREPQQDKENSGLLQSPAPGGNGADLLNANIEHSDDAPTIISSRLVNRTARPEDSFPGNLRGRHLAHFELIEPIGVGGMAAVIRARDTQLDRNVALKILPPEMAVDPENVRRFHQEARAAAKLDHENIARVFFCGEDQGLHFIAFEFVEGENLRTILDRRGCIPVPEAVHYLLQVATGLAHSSARGVVHRDIKPSNIIITSNKRAKLVDMGLARSLEPQNDPGLTHSGVTLGTFDYISPEQALEPREADLRSDIYSLGCTFYHMVTGRPPVPEGTAAKKLHHHQNVAPIDPRQINREIPDEVAAILGRMMAKDPKDRYQRAEHLVQHLIQLAHKLGAIGDVPDGVLFVDAALPSPPRNRPVLVAVVAAAILLVLVILHSMSPWNRFQQPSGNQVARANTESNLPEPTSNPKALANAQENKIDPGPLPPVVQPVVTKDFAKADELANFLSSFSKSESTTANLYLIDDLDLKDTAANADREPGLYFQGPGHNITIQPKESSGMRTIKLAYNGLSAGLDGAPPVLTAFTIKDGMVTLRRIRFEIDATQASIVMAAIKLQAGSLRLQECEFIQINPPGEKGRISSVVVEGSASIPSLDLERCYFGVHEREELSLGNQMAINQAAVAIEGASKVDVVDCAFAPHTSLFHVFKGGKADTSLKLGHCSAFLADGSAFQIDDAVNCQISVKDCLFSHPEAGNVSSATLIRQNGDGRLTYVGFDNCYHNLGTFWLRPAPSAESAAAVVAATFEDFNRELLNTRGQDTKSRTTARSPWVEEEPLALLRTGKTRQAFTPNIAHSEIRQVDHPNTDIVGAERCAWGNVYDGSLPPLEEKKPETATGKIVDPTVKYAGNGVYPSLVTAIAEAHSGDEIRIKKSGLLKVDPIILDKVISITIKPYLNERPILTFGLSSNTDAALFRIHDGQVAFENISFQLKPDRDEFTTQVVVNIVGDGQCSFKNCVITLDEPRSASLAVVKLSDSTGIMRMDPQIARSSVGPKAMLDHCFVRGQGDLLMVRAGRPMELEVDHTLVAVGGSFLSVEGGLHDPSDRIIVKLTRVTACVGDYFARLFSRDLKGRVGLTLRSPTDCLFCSSSSGGKSLIHLDGLEPTESQLRQLFSWESGEHNAFSNFLPLLDQQPKSDDMMPPLLSFNRDKWKAFTNEMDAIFFPAKFVDPPMPGRPLAKMIPDNFRLRPESEVQRYGAVIEQLPQPTGDTSSNAP